MGLMADAIRPFWMHGLHTVCGRPTGSVASWLTDQRGWEVYKCPAAPLFTVFVSDIVRLQSAFAYDVSRMTTAAFESAAGIQSERFSKRSTAWIVIRAYYSAYFASHAIMRMTGTTCTQLGSDATKAITRIADLFGFPGTTAVQDGYYRCQYSPATSELIGTKITGPNGGSHEVFWNNFRLHLKDLSTQILRGKLPQRDAQTASIKIDEAIKNLEYTTSTNHPSGQFLTKIRNGVNYRQTHGSWYPYKDADTNADTLIKLISQWKNDSCSIKTTYFGTKDLERFICTCAFLLALCGEISGDMQRRCPTGKSFHQVGAGAFLSLLGQMSE